MKIVEILQNLPRGLVSVYTIYDNFITTALYTKKLPNIYTGVFVEMSAPLRIINSFLYVNLIKGNSPSLDSPSSYDHPFECETIREILMDHLPKGYCPIKWDEKVDSLLTYYYKYCITVYGDDPVEKWNAFKVELQRWSEMNNNCSIHY